LLLTLSLQHRRSEKRDLLALADAAQNLGVVEVADPDSYEPRRVFPVLLHEHYLPAAAPASSTTRASAGATTGAGLTTATGTGLTATK
jgi:hypothetical protein